MPTRTAHTEWNGGLNDGTGKVQLVSSGAGVTSPEELIAAAHTSCYCMQLSGVIGKAGGTPKSLVADAVVSLGPDPDGGLRLTGIALKVRGEVDGLDEAGFLEAAETAKVTCPVSKALTGVEITLDAALA